MLSSKIYQIDIVCLNVILQNYFCLSRRKSLLWAFDWFSLFGQKDSGSLVDVQQVALSFPEIIMGFLDEGCKKFRRHSFSFSRIGSRRQCPSELPFRLALFSIFMVPYIVYISVLVSNHIAGYRFARHGSDRSSKRLHINL